MSKRNYIIPIFIPHQGCGHDCIFCNQRHITGTDGIKINISEQINEYMEYIEDKSNVELAFYGGSFTGIGFDLMRYYLEEVKTYIKKGQIDSIRISTRPDYINKEILSFLKNYNVETIELGVQSMVDEVLVKNKRGTIRSKIIESANLIRLSGFSLGLQMMTGLYGSSLEDDIYTAFEITKLSPDFVRIYPTMILPKTELYHFYNEGKYIPMNVETMLNHLYNIVIIFEANEIDIIRLGLYSDGKNTEKDVVGPFHPATKQIIYSRLYMDMIKNELNKHSESIDFYVNKKEVDYISGYKSSNRKYLKELGINSSIFKSDIKERLIIMKSDKFISELNLKDYCKNYIGEFYET